MWDIKGLLLRDQWNAASETKSMRTSLLFVRTVLIVRRRQGRGTADISCFVLLLILFLSVCFMYYLTTLDSCTVCLNTLQFGLQHDEKSSLRKREVGLQSRTHLLSCHLLTPSSLQGSAVQLFVGIMVTMCTTHLNIQWLCILAAEYLWVSCDSHSD
jgi:hypothetical protein